MKRKTKPPPKAHGRPKALTDSQVSEAIDRVVKGENVLSIANEWGVPEATLRRHVTGESRTVKSLGKRTYELAKELNSLDEGMRLKVFNRADAIGRINQLLIKATEASCNTLNNVAKVGEVQSGKIDAENPDTATLDVVEQTAKISNSMGGFIIKAVESTAFDDPDADTGQEVSITFETVEEPTPEPNQELEEGE